MAARRTTRRRPPEEELLSRLKKLLTRVGKSQRWKQGERERWQDRMKEGVEVGSNHTRRLGEHLFRLAGRISGPAAAAEARRLSAIFRVIAETPAAGSTEDALRITLTALRDGIEFESATGFLYDRAEYRLVPSVVVGSHVDLIPDFAFEHGVGLSSWVVKTRRPVLLSALRRDAEMPETHRPASFLSVPLIDGEEVAGVINMAHRRAGAFTEADRDLLILTTRFLVEKLEQFQSAHTLGSHGRGDSLLASRRHLEVRLQEEELASLRGHQNFALVGVCLRGTNGNGYHNSVDDGSLSEAVTEYIQALPDGAGVACRLGESSVAVLLPHVSIQEAWRMAGELREHVAGHCVPERNGVKLEVASVIYPKDAQSGSEVLNRVESLLGVERLPDSPSTSSQAECA